MKANQILRTGLLGSSIVGISLFSLSLVGCGTDLSTNPGASLMSSGENEDVGALPIPVRRTDIPAPRGLSAEILSVSTVLVSWQRLPGQYQAMVTLDGREVGLVSASEGQITDSSPKAAGTHTYGVCFVKGKKLGDAAWISLEIKDHPTTDGDPKKDRDHVGQGSN